MGSPFDFPLITHFFSFHKTNRLNSCLQGFGVVFWRRYADYIFVFYNVNDHLKYFYEILVYFISACLSLWGRKTKRKLFENKVNLHIQPQIIINLILVTYIVDLQIDQQIQQIFFFFCLKLLDNMHLILQMFSYLLGLEKNQYSLTRIQDRGGGGG